MQLIASALLSFLMGAITSYVYLKPNADIVQTIEKPSYQTCEETGLDLPTNAEYIQDESSGSCSWQCIDGYVEHKGVCIKVEIRHCPEALVGTCKVPITDLNTSTSGLCDGSDFSCCSAYCNGNGTWSLISSTCPQAGEFQCNQSESE